MDRLGDPEKSTWRTWREEKPDMFRHCQHGLGQLSCFY